MEEVYAVDLVSEKLYPGLYKEYNGSLNIIKQLLSRGYESDCYKAGFTLRECYKSLKDIRNDELLRVYETVCIGSDMSLEDSELVLKAMSERGLYLGYCSKFSDDNHKNYTLLEKPVLKVYTNNHKELYEKLLMKAILNYNSPELDYDDEGMYNQEMDYGIDYNSKEFIGKVKRFLKYVGKSNTFDMDFYERYSDVIDYFILYRYEGFDLDIREYNVSWRFALGYSDGTFSFVAYRDY